VKKYFVSLLLFFCWFYGFSQKFKTIELKPIVRQGGMYYYDLKKVHGGAYGLQIPLQSLNDDEINRRYKTFRTLRVFEGIVATVPAIYIVSISRNQIVNQTEFWTVFGVSIATSLGLELVAHLQIKKGIDRYNTLVIGVSSQVIGPSLIYKF
jgi:hypothetical protein